MKAAFLIEPGKVEFRETSRPELAPGRSTDSTDSSWHLRVRCFLFFGPPRNILSPPPWSRTCGAGSGSGEWCNQIRNWCAGYCGAKLSLWFVPLLSYGTRPYLPEQDKHGGNGARMLCRLCGGACRVRFSGDCWKTSPTWMPQPSSHWRFQYMHWINQAPGAGDTVAVVGCGGIGLLLIHAAVAEGVRVLAAGRSSIKLDRARQLGAVAVPNDADVTELWREQGVSSVFECAGSTATVELAIGAAPRGSTVLLVG